MTISDEIHASVKGVMKGPNPWVSGMHENLSAGRIRSI